MTATMIDLDDGAQLRTWTAGLVTPHQHPVVLVHGGPGVPDYLAPVAGIISDLCLVHRYDQRGTGGSHWEGEHTIARHVHDLELLLDAWGHDRAVLTGHSYGTDLVSRFLLAHPERVAGLVQIAGPFLEPWREAYRAAERARSSAEQQAWLDELDAIQARTEAEEIEYLTLSWFTDHNDRERAWDCALASARTQRPVNYAMNAQLNAATKTNPLESHVDELREYLPAGTVIIGGAGDTRPATALRRLAARLNCEVIIIPDVGHDPWLEAPGRFGAALHAAVHKQAQRPAEQSPILTPDAGTMDYHPVGVPSAGPKPPSSDTGHPSAPTRLDDTPANPRARPGTPVPAGPAQQPCHSTVSGQVKCPEPDTIRCQLSFRADVRAGPEQLRDLHHRRQHRYQRGRAALRQVRGDP